MSHDPSGIRLNYKYVAEKDEDEERGDRGEVSHLTDDGEHFVPSLIRIPRDEEHNHSGIRLQYKHKEEDGGERDGGGQFFEPTLIRLPPAEEHKRENITSSDADDDNKKPAATADLSRVSDHDVSPRTVARTLGEPVYRVQFPQADSPTGRRNHSMYKMEMKASKNSQKTAPPSAFDAASLGDPWPSSGITMLPGAQWASPESERIKNDTIGQAAAGNKPTLRPHFVSSPANEPPLQGSAQLKSPPVLSPSMTVASAPPKTTTTTTTGPKNNHEDSMHVKALIRAWEKMNIEKKSTPTDNQVPFGPNFKDQARGFNPIEKQRIEMKSVPTDNRVPFGPKFKDQARGFNPMEEERVENVDSRESSTRVPTFRHYMREEDSEEEINTEASDATSADRGHEVISNGTTRLVQAELVIPAEAEVIEEKPLRKACLAVLALLLTGAIVGSIVGKIAGGNSPIVTLLDATGCDKVIELEVGIFEAFRPAVASIDTWGSCNISNAFSAPATGGAWYQVIGNDTRYTATTCGGNDLDLDLFPVLYYPDNLINVYSGMECLNLTCSSLIDSHSSEAEMCNDGVSWPAKRGVQYWIQVLVFSNGGSFPVVVFPTPPHQKCEDAIMLEAGQETVNGSTLGALAGPNDSFCGTAWNHEGVPAVWYSVTGTDEVLYAFTCADFDNQILVYSETCGNLTCIDGNDDYYGSMICSSNYAAAVSWFAKAEMVYYIKVTGNIYEYSTVGTVGTFELGILIVPKQDCEDAIMLEAGQETVNGTTVGALAGPKDSFCGSTYDHEGVPAVWYSVIGTDEDLNAFTCADFDVQILVYNGTCGNLTCIDGKSYHDDDRICSSAYYAAAVVSWFAKAGTVYHIKMTGYDDGVFNNIAVGTFELGIRIGKTQSPYPTAPPKPPPENDNCEGAKWVSHELTGSTTYATASDFLFDELSVCSGESPLSYYHLSPDVWYQFNGTGEWHMATTCTGIDSLDYFDSYVAIYSGTCSNLTCITSNDNAFSSDCSPYNAIASWLTQEGETYLIRVSGTKRHITGDFGIRIDDGEFELPPEPVNNHCENATLLELNHVVNGTTVAATPTLEVPSCDQGTYSPGEGRPDVWYHLLGTGDILTVTTCTNTSFDDREFDTYIVVYTGNCTSEMTCIAENDADDRDSCSGNLLSGVSWQSELNEEYYVQVFGYNDSTLYPFGTFWVEAYRGTPDGKPLPDPDSTIPPSYG